MKKILSSLLLFIYTILILCLLQSTSYSWSGYDYDNKVDIDIGEGNLVREGLIIEFYDAKSDSYHQGKVLLLESDSGSVMLQILDLDTNLNRTFIMQN